MRAARAQLQRDRSGRGAVTRCVRRARGRRLPSGNARANALTPPTSAATTATYLAKTVEILRQERTAIFALAAPAADRPFIRAELNAVAKEATSFTKAKGDAASNDPAGYDADLTHAKSFHDTASKFAKKLGLKPCEELTE